jgi:hypothetical protein
MQRRGFALACCLLCLGLWALPDRTDASTEVRSARAVRTDVPPVIDGKLDDPVWQRAAVTGDFRQVLPVEGVVPSERTEVRLLYDSDALYLGIRMYDSEPDKLIATQMTHDNTQVADDRINLVFDTFHDQRNAFFFQINPAGSRSEALIENNEKFRREWDTIWYAKATVDEQGWVAEFAIPFRSVSFDPDSTTWGMEIERYIRRRNENARWANPSRNRTIGDVAGIGTLEGLEGLEGTGVDIKPTYSLSYQAQREKFPNSIPPPETLKMRDGDVLGRPGGDIFYKPDPRVTGALTLNTDFSEAAVDLRQSNLSRSALLFPETRDFFLQDAGIFEFGGRVERLIPFFSRRIGLVVFDPARLGSNQNAPDYQPVDIQAGLKLTGRIGRFNFGALQVRTEGTSGTSSQDPNDYVELDPANLSVVRVQANVLEESQLGFIVTDGDPKDQRNNSVYGVDFRYRNSTIQGSNILKGDFWYQHSETSGKSGRNGGQDAFGAEINYPNDRINFKLAYEEYGEDFTQLLGFTNRPTLGLIGPPGIRRYDGVFRYRLRPGGWLRTVDFALEGKVVTDRRNTVDTNRWVFRPIELANNAGDSLKVSYIVQRERVEKGFSLPYLDPWIPTKPDGSSTGAPKTYHFDSFTVIFDTTTARPVRGKLEFNGGEFYTGHLWTVKGLLELRPSPHWFFSAEYEQHAGRLRAEFDDDSEPHDANFLVRIARVNLNLNFSPDLSWTNVIQYDNVSDSVGLNSRLRWEVESGNELFLVFNQGYEVDNSSIVPRTTQAIGKVGWTFRF